MSGVTELHAASRGGTTLESRRIRLEDVELHYVETVPDRVVEGPIVLLHGIGMDWRVWQGVARRLGVAYRLLMLDLRGHGRSDKPPCGYTLGDYAADIEQLLVGLSLRDVTLVGSSMGGLVAAAVEPGPGEVGRRVLVDPPLRRGRRRRGMFQELLSLKTLADESLPVSRNQFDRPSGQDERSLNARSMAKLRQRVFAVLKEAEPRAGTLSLRYMAEAWSEAASGVLREALAPSEGPSEIEEALVCIQEPTLIMRGNPDLGAVLEPEEAERARALLCRGAVAYFERAGHAIHGSVPDAFVRRLVEFIKESAVGPAA